MNGESKVCIRLPSTNFFFHAILLVVVVFHPESSFEYRSESLSGVISLNFTLALFVALPPP
jgi:hypothetical protein